MGNYSRITRSWLERRFARIADDGSHLAHQPIYGVNHPASEDGHPGRFARLLRLLRVLDGLRAGSFLDVGGAEGYVAWLVQQLFGAEVTSCDLSLHAGQRARALFAVQAAAVDSARLPFADGSFDVVLCSEVIEHV